MKACCVFGCKSESYKNCEIHFFKFPKCGPIRKQWIDVVPAKVSQYSVICHLHFKPADILAVSSRPKLHPDAIPSIFPTTITGTGIPNRSHILCMDKNKMLNVDDNDNILKVLKDHMLKVDRDNILIVPSKPEGPPNKEILCSSNDYKPEKCSKVQSLQRQVKILNQRLQRKDKRIKELKSILKTIKSKCTNYDEFLEQIKNKRKKCQIYLGYPTTDTYDCSPVDLCSEEEIFLEPEYIMFEEDSD